MFGDTKVCVCILACIPLEGNMKNGCIEEQKFDSVDVISLSNNSRITYNAPKI